MQEWLPHIVGINDERLENKSELRQPCLMRRTDREPNKRDPNGIFRKKTMRPVERICTDVVGPMNKESLGRSR